MRLIVIGGGAAGFFCAVNAARMNPAMETIIIEKTGKLLSKVRVSGGGRCNVTHACFSIPEMSRHYPRGTNFVKKAFHQFFTSDTIAWFKERGVILKTEDDGRIFPVSDDSATIVNCLLQEADKYGVSIWMNRELKSIHKTDDQWELVLSNGECHKADKICIACGGYPKASMFEWIRHTGHAIEPPTPSLFTFNVPGDPLTQLMGIAVLQVSVKIQETKLEETGPALITHWGLSGPAILKLSARGARILADHQYQFSITVNWLPSQNEQLLREQFQRFRGEAAGQKIRGRNSLGLPHRLWEYLCQQSGIGEDMRWGDMPSAKQNALLKNTCSQEIMVKGKTTFKEEFVTAGGVKLSEIDVNTMQSKLIPSLFFAGEIMDVDGVTGGFNFQHAWTSGWIAARAIASAALPVS
ncbi:MAG: NAD(P)/FAD-dependent oxidoreductase [Chitinophagaceae bacterium]|nr:NAD(P)/FAD-dependent oxidoreductase [Chitinophagaceae bacterium]